MEIEGELEAKDPLFEGLQVPLTGPLAIGGSLERALARAGSTGTARSRVR